MFLFSFFFFLICHPASKNNIQLFWKLVTSHLLFTSFSSQICERGSVCSFSCDCSWQDGQMYSMLSQIYSQIHAAKKENVLVRREKNFFLWLFLDRRGQIYMERGGKVSWETRHEGGRQKTEGKNCLSHVYLSVNLWGRTENLWFPSRLLFFSPPLVGCQGVACDLLTLYRVVCVCACVRVCVRERERERERERWDGRGEVSQLHREGVGV